MRCRISRSLLPRLVAEAEAQLPNEACGILIGRDGEIVDAIPTANAAADPLHGFEVDQTAHLRISRAARRCGQQIIGCYHSHTIGPAIPSQTDIERAWQSQFYWLIIARGDVRLWRVGACGGANRFSPIVIEVEPSPCNLRSLRPIGGAHDCGI